MSNFSPRCPRCGSIMDITDLPGAEFVWDCVHYYGRGRFSHVLIYVNYPEIELPFVQDLGGFEAEV